MHINQIRTIIESEGIIFLTYGGILSQTLITGMIDALEKEAEDNNLKMGIANNIFTIFIELTQNMMNYSSRHDQDSEISTDGLILVAKEEEQGKIKNYLLHSNNVVSKDAKEKLEDKLQGVVTLGKEELKKKYRQVRREGKDKHSLGAGIGFLEIAKRSDKMNYHFEVINENQFYFNLNISIMITD